MKRISVLTASIAIALTGCGSDSGDSPTNGGTPVNGTVITGFDGYFKNAVVFIDGEQPSGTKGEWDASDTFLGLTNENGQLNIGDTAIPSGATLAIQTLTPSGNAQAKLIAIDPTEYSGVYTVDMDLSGQAMEHEVVFRAPNNSAVISPITDLVTIEMDKGKTESEAISAVQTNLGMADLDPYSDFVAEANSGDADAALVHKTAQILTQTKADPTVDYEGKIEDVTKEAKQVADSIAADPTLDITDPSLVIPVDGDFLTPETPSYKTVVNPVIYQQLQNTLDALNLKFGGHGSNDYFIDAFDITDLFTNSDTNVVIDPVNFYIADATQTQLTGSNIEFMLGRTGNDKNDLYLGVSPSNTIDKAGEFALIIELRESAAQDAEVIATARFELNVDADGAVPPVYANDDLAALQQEVDANWTFMHDQSIYPTSLDFSQLFANGEGTTGAVTLSVSSNTDTSGIDIAHDGSGLITVSGRPNYTAPAGDYSLLLTATDSKGLSSTVVLNIPQVATRPVHKLENKTWYVLDNTPLDRGESGVGTDHVWCDSIRFENGKVLFNDRTATNRTECGEPTVQIEQSSYFVDAAGQELVIAYSWIPQGETEAVTETHQVWINNESDDIGQGAITVGTSYRSDIADPNSDPVYDRYVYFADKLDAQARIEVTSDDAEAEQAFAFHYPKHLSEYDIEWNVGTVSVSINASSDASVVFEDPNQDITCAYLDKYYASFALTGDDIGEVTNSVCTEATKQGATYSHATVNFTGNALTINNIYSLIGYVRTVLNDNNSQTNGNGQYIESVKYNIEWMGAN